MISVHIGDVYAIRQIFLIPGEEDVLCSFAKGASLPSSLQFSSLPRPELMFEQDFVGQSERTGTCEESGCSIQAGQDCKHECRAVEGKEDRRLDSTSWSVMKWLWEAQTLIRDCRYRRTSLSSISHVLLRHIQFGGYSWHAHTWSSSKFDISFWKAPVANAPK